VRINTCPAAGTGTSHSASRKFSAVGAPLQALRCRAIEATCRVQRRQRVPEASDLVAELRTARLDRDALAIEVLPAAERT